MVHAGWSAVSGLPETISGSEHALIPDFAVYDFSCGVSGPPQKSKALVLQMISRVYEKTAALS